MDIETQPAKPAVTRIVIDQPATPAKVILELSQAEVLLIAAALAHIPVGLLEQVGLGDYCCDRLTKAAGLGRDAWVDVLTPTEGRLDMGPAWEKAMGPVLNQ